MEAVEERICDQPVLKLTYLASLPATGLSSAQVAQAQSDEKDLGKFFGTPGLMD